MSSPGKVEGLLQEDNIIDFVEELLRAEGLISNRKPVEARKVLEDLFMAFSDGKWASHFHQRMVAKHAITTKRLLDRFLVIIQFFQDSLIPDPSAPSLNIRKSSSSAKKIKDTVNAHLLRNSAHHFLRYLQTHQEDPDNALIGLRPNKAFVRKYWLRAGRLGRGMKNALFRAAPSSSSSSSSSSSTSNSSSSSISNTSNSNSPQSSASPTSASSTSSSSSPLSLSSSSSSSSSASPLSLDQDAVPERETRKTLFLQLIDWSRLEPEKLHTMIRNFTAQLRPADLFSEGDLVMVKLTTEVQDSESGTVLSRPIVRFARFHAIKGDMVVVSVDPHERSTLTVPLSDVLPLYADMLALLGSVETMQKLITDQIVDAFEEIDKLIDVTVRQHLVRETPEFDMAFIDKVKALDLQASDFSRIPVYLDLLQKFRKSPALAEIAGSLEQQVSEKIHVVERTLEPDLLFPPTRDYSRQKLKKYASTPLSPDVPLAQMNDLLLKGMEHLRRERQLLLDGTTKNALAEWWLDKIECSVDAFLHRQQFNFQVIPENYTEECPSDLEAIKTNLELVRRFITGKDERSKQMVRLFVNDLRSDIYLRIDRFLVDIYYLIASELRKHGATEAQLPESRSNDMGAMEEAFALLRPQLEKTLPEVVFYLKELIEDAKYITEMKESEQDLTAADPKSLTMSRIVPIGGLIFSRFFRVENELMTILDLWDNSRAIKARLASPPRQSRAVDDSPDKDASRPRSKSPIAIPRRSGSHASLDKRISRENLASVVTRKATSSKLKGKDPKKVKRRGSSKKINDLLNPKGLGDAAGPLHRAGPAADSALSIAIPPPSELAPEAPDVDTPTTPGAAFKELQWDAVIKKTNSKILRVFLDNRNFKTVAINLPATVEDLCQAVLKKCRDIDTANFALFQQYKQVDIEPLEGYSSSIDIGTIMFNWGPDHRFMFRKKTPAPRPANPASASAAPTSSSASSPSSSASSPSSSSSSSSAGASNPLSLSDPPRAAGDASAAKLDSPRDNATEAESEAAAVIESRLMHPPPADPSTLDISQLLDTCKKLLVTYPPPNLPRFAALPMLSSCTSFDNSRTASLALIREVLLFGRPLMSAIVDNLLTSSAFLHVALHFAQVLIGASTQSAGELAHSFQSFNRVFLSLSLSLYYRASGFTQNKSLQSDFWNAIKCQMMQLLARLAYPATLSSWNYVPPLTPSNSPPHPKEPEQDGPVTSSSSSSQLPTILPVGRRPGKN